MKAIFRMLLTAMLLMALAGAALAAPGDATLFGMQETGEYIYTQSIVEFGGALYALTERGVYRYEAGADAPQLVAEIDEADAVPGDETSGMDMLIPGGDALYGLNTMTGELSRLTWPDGVLVKEPVIQLDWTDMLMTIQGGHQMQRARTRGILMGDKLYLLRMNDDYLTNELVRYDIATGKSERVSSEGISSFAPYKGDKLIAIIRYANNYEDPAQIAEVDPSTGSVSMLFQAKGAYDYGIQYDEASDTIYFMSGSELYASVNGAEPQVAAYIPIENAWDSAPTAYLPGGYYAVSSFENILVRNTDPQYKAERALKISGIYSDETSRAFMKDRPDIPLVLGTEHFGDMEKLTANMTGGDVAHDLYVLSMGYGQFNALAEKGYMADLSSNEVLMNAVNAMYPDIQNALMRDGKLLAFPQYYSGYGMGYSPKVLETIGLTQDDLPRTYIEFLEFVTRWEDEFAAQYPDLKLFDNQNEMDLQSSILGTIFQSYMTYYTSLGEEPVFDTPLFKKLMEAVEKADYSGFKQRDPDEEEGGGVSVVYAVFGEDAGPTALFTQYKPVTLSDYRYDDGYEPLPLSLDDDLPALVGAEMEVFIVNPNSPNADLAMEYLEYCANNMSGAMKANLMPNENEPVRNPSYDEMKQRMEAYVNEAQAAYDKAKGTENEKAMELELTSAQDSLKYVLKYEWSATKESIAAYRAVHDNLIINTGNIFYDGGGEQSQELASLIQRYIDGQIPAEQLARELDKKIRMMLQEGR